LKKVIAMHEKRMKIIKMKLELKKTEELKQMWESRDQGEHSKDVIEAVKRILIDRGERIAV